MSAVQRNIARLRKAAEQGKILALQQVWSPTDTPQDTRYQIRDMEGRSLILQHSEIGGFLAGLEKSR